MAVDVPAPPADSRLLANVVSRGLRGDLSWGSGEVRDLDLVARAASYHGVSALLWRVLHQRPDSPPGLVAQLATTVNGEVARAAIRERDLATVARAFRAHGVEMVLVKGAALAYTCYADPWLRARTDTDVLVRRESVDAAAAALRDAGYSPSKSLSTGDLVSHQVAFERVDEHGGQHVIDVHWKIVNPQILANVMSFADVWSESREIHLRGSVIRVPASEWSLLLACVHRLAHHQAQERLIWLYDIQLLADALTPAGWERFTTIAAQRQVSAICADGLAAAIRLMDARIPTAVVSTLDDQGQQDPSRRYTVREQRRLDVLRDDLRQLDWQDRVRLLREHAFPPASFMRSQYQVRSNVLLPLLYARRLIAGAYKWIRA
jgi:hypothetical protein